MLIFFLVFIYENMISEARVYCEDSNASPWQPLGHSCPVNCANIVTAVEKLKMNDYQKIFNEKNIQSTTPMIETLKLIEKQTNKTKLLRKIFNFANTHLKGKQHKDLNVLYSIFKNVHALRHLRTKFKEYQMKCPKILKKYGLKPMQLKRLDKKCFRRFDRNDFLKTFTDVLNKYTHSEYQFTDELTAMLLEKILGNNMDLRHGIFDVNKIIKYMSDAISNHEAHRNKDLVIKMSSKHCLNLFVPGCFCRPGFVESSGQCVMPSDCFPNTLQSEYLARIVIH